METREYFGALSGLRFKVHRLVDEHGIDMTLSPPKPSDAELLAQMKTRAVPPAPEELGGNTAGESESLSPGAIPGKLRPGTPSISDGVRMPCQ
jgi:hypothetical protein